MRNNKKYSDVIENLKSMYEDRKIEIEKLKILLAKGLLTSDEFDFILKKKEMVA